MSRRDPPRYTQNMMADHLRRTHHIPTLDPGEIGMRTSRRRQCLLRWHEPEAADGTLGVWYRCERCRQTYGEGWDRYYAAVHWPWPLPHHQDAISGHYRQSHPARHFDADRISSPGSPRSDWQATFVPLTPTAPAGFLCAACRSAEEPRLAHRIPIGTDAYGDARRLRALRATRLDLQADLAGRTSLQQAELLEARDRGLLLTDLHPKTIRTALASTRVGGRAQETTDYLEAAMITILRQARDRGDQPTPLIKGLVRLAEKRPAVFTITVGRAIPQLAAQEQRQSPMEFRRSVRTLLGTDAPPTIRERRLWDIWTRHVRDGD